MKKPLHRSLLLHAALLFFAVVSLPDFFWWKPEPEFFTVDLVKIADKANIKPSEVKGAKPTKDETPKSNKIEEKKPEPKVEPKPEEAKKVEEKPKEEKTKEPSELIKKEKKKEEKPKEKPKTDAKKDKQKPKAKPEKKAADYQFYCGWFHKV